MKLSVPHAALERVLYVLHSAGVALLLQPTGPGWIVESPRKVDADWPALGATVL